MRAENAHEGEPTDLREVQTMCHISSECGQECDGVLLFRKSHALHDIIQQHLRLLQRLAVYMRNR